MAQSMLFLYHRRHVETRPSIGLAPSTPNFYNDQTPGHAHLVRHQALFSDRYTHHDHDRELLLVAFGDGPRITPGFKQGH